jgi:hypothetical protein
VNKVLRDYMERNAANDTGPRDKARRKRG